MIPYLLFTLKCNKCNVLEVWNLSMLNDYAMQYDGKTYVKGMYKCTGHSCRGTLVLYKIEAEKRGGDMKTLFPE